MTKPDLQLKFRNDTVYFSFSVQVYIEVQLVVDRCFIFKMDLEPKIDFCMQSSLSVVICLKCGIASSSWKAVAWKTCV